MSIVAKVRCNSVVESNNNSGDKYSEQISFSAVYDPDPNSENGKWSAATPAMSVSMTITNPGAWGAFEQGKEYLVTFNEA